ncbi:MAG: hypothetical protein HUJ26_22940 [Planctomycetaceae bacterium]|nr:hypothetical protein [Planctomycetaceae bacterium]
MALQFPYKAGDCVIYRKTKHSTQPGPRARSINPNPNGDEYTYLVDKFWVVEEVLSNQDIILRTRRGKRHTVSMDDPNLRKANIWERFWHRDRFESMLEQVAEEN